MTKKITVKQALNELNTKYAKTLEMLDSSLDVIEDLENEVDELKTTNNILQKDLLKKPKVITINNNCINDSEVIQGLLQ